MRAHNDFIAPDRPLVTRMRAPIPDIKYNLPPYEWAEFPKMALKHATKEDIEFLQNQCENYDDRVQKMRYTQRVPKLGSLIPLRDPDSMQVVIFDDEDEETTFYANHPDIERVVLEPGRSVPQVNEAELEEFRVWKADKAKRANALQNAGTHLGGEEEQLRGKLHAGGIDVDKRWGLKRLREEVAKLPVTEGNGG